MLESLHGYKTILVNSAIGLVALLATVMGFLVSFDWSTVLSPKWAGMAVLSVNVLNIVLRCLTTTPVGVAKDPAP